MKFKHILKSALRSIAMHKSRSTLTILGIVIGITSIIVIMSVGNGAMTLITGEIASLGADIIWIEPGREPEGPAGFANTALTRTLKDKDIKALLNKSNVPGIAEIAPAISVPGSTSYRGETYKPFIIGWSAEFLGRVFGIFPEEGDYFSESAIRNNERVAVIGFDVREELFGSGEAVGKNIKINGKNFRVVGVLADVGQVLFFDMGELVLVPYSTAQSYLMGIDHFNEVWVRVADINAIPSTVEDIKRTLRERHGITNPKKDDFYILTQDKMLDQINGIIDILTYAVVSIAAIALVVGGVGIMNIMLVSVTERTKEIGLRKSLGATSKDVLKQFMVEAIAITVLGGILGVLFGFLISWVVAELITSLLGVHWEVGFSPYAALVAVVISTVIGLVFGVYPAREASKKSPIEALRYDL